MQNRIKILIGNNLLFLTISPGIPNLLKILFNFHIIYMLISGFMCVIQDNICQKEIMIWKWNEISEGIYLDSIIKKSISRISVYQIRYIKFHIGNK